MLGYFEAQIHQNCPRALTFLADPIKSRLSPNLCASIAATRVTSVQTGAVTMDSATDAAVLTNLTESSGALTEYVIVVKKGTYWYVSDLIRR